MFLPTYLILISAGGLLDGGTSWILAVDDSNEYCVVSRNQSMFPGTDNPGRLFFNKQMINIRSEEERRIVSLLNDATIENNRNIPVEHQNMFSSVDSQFVESSRKELVRYIGSDTYYDVSINGIPDEESRKRWWQIFY